IAAERGLLLLDSRCPVTHGSTPCESTKRMKRGARGHRRGARHAPRTTAPTLAPLNVGLLEQAKQIQVQTPSRRYRPTQPIIPPQAHTSLQRYQACTDTVRP